VVRVLEAAFALSRGEALFGSRAAQRYRILSVLRATPLSSCTVNSRCVRHSPNPTGRGRFRRVGSVGSRQTTQFPQLIDCVHDVAPHRTA